MQAARNGGFRMQGAKRGFRMMRANGGLECYRFRNARPSMKTRQIKEKDIQGLEGWGLS